jgi:cell wall-associated NlpC family hydrolase
MTHWSAAYIGIPFVAGGRSQLGCDCYGLITLVYHDVASIELPPLNGLYVTAEEREDIARIVEGEVAHGPWTPVEPGDEQDLDVALFRCFGLQSHVGVICGRGLMLHATSGQTSAVERYTGPRWITRFQSAWRHKSLRARP